MANAKDVKVIAQFDSVNEIPELKTRFFELIKVESFQNYCKNELGIKKVIVPEQKYFNAKSIFDLRHPSEFQDLFYELNNKYFLIFKIPLIEYFKEPNHNFGDLINDRKINADTPNHELDFYLTIAEMYEVSSMQLIEFLVGGTKKKYLFADERTQTGYLTESPLSRKLRYKKLNFELTRLEIENLVDAIGDNKYQKNSAWISSMLFTHFLFNRNKEFLESHDAAIFQWALFEMIINAHLRDYKSYFENVKNKIRTDVKTKYKEEFKLSDEDVEYLLSTIKDDTITKKAEVFIRKYTDLKWELFYETIKETYKLRNNYSHGEPLLKIIIENVKRKKMPFYTINRFEYFLDCLILNIIYRLLGLKIPERIIQQLNDWNHYNKINPVGNIENSISNKNNSTDSL
ncbi:MAG: hypothetical protein IPJ89_00335 [Candidatus Iainarchaeum archaeon]|uniref:Uncharacterized protein n=1 Tax=Candidatus Iainarchaeum sp. TaxID=3101447 RepID=A0A7T9DJV7_9ARCH|nr:MAG: hypothetical protein IPJ89_00335 [Candidatus Diapherotrites archaeon]